MAAYQAPSVYRPSKTLWFKHPCSGMPSSILKNRRKPFSVFLRQLTDDGERKEGGEKGGP